MPRPIRIIIDNGLYHVMARGNKKSNIFLEPQDYEHYLNLLIKYKEKYGFKLICYVLMPNHSHLLIETTEQGTISKIMHGINLSYTLYFNNKYRAIGHVFQGRFKSLLVEKETYLLELSRYIHLNPVRASLVKTPENYIYSSFKDYIGQGKQTGLVDYSEILSRFGENKMLSCNSYNLYVTATRPLRNVTEDIKKQSFLGSKEFVARMQVLTLRTDPQK